MDTDVIVIGAGLAGLQAARRAERNGRSVIVLEAEEVVGGRVQTAKVDGFLLDRGFQVLNPAYPAVRDWINLDALQMQQFGLGVQVRTSADTLTTLAHPLRHPEYALETLQSDLMPMSDLISLARWLAPTLARPSVVYNAKKDQQLSVSLDEAGVTGKLRRSVLDTFLGGVLGDSTGETSANYVRMLLRYFVLGGPGLPRNGMQALPEQMAAWLRAPVRVNHAVRKVTETAEGVRVETNSGSVKGRVAIVAVGAQDVSELTGMSAPTTQGLSTWWFRATKSPHDGKFLILDGSGTDGGPAGPIWHTAVMTNSAPSYGPKGEHLIEATTLLDRPDGLVGEVQIRQELERIYQTSTKGWDLLKHDVIEHAIPTQRPPLQDKRPVWTGDRILVTGDHRATGSIQGALVSGDHAGQQVERVFA